ncbi:MAG: hypothetical protein ACE366_27450 [Bradymonadia bacterium]
MRLLKTIGMTAVGVTMLAGGLFAGAQAQPGEKMLTLSQLTGAPVISRISGPAYYLWADDQGWHLRWTAPAHTDPEKKPLTFTGIVKVQNGVKAVRPVMVGGDDSMSRIDQQRAFFKGVITEGKTIEGLPAGVEGMDFKVPKGADAIELELFIDHKAVTPAQVHLGPLQKQPNVVVPSVLVPLMGR